MKKHEKITIGLLGILLILNINQGNTITRLKSTVENQMHQIANLNSSIQNIQGSVNHTLSNWEKENRWLHSSSHIIQSISDDGDNMEVSVEWQFNELKNDEVVYLMIGEKSNTSEYEWEKVRMESNGDLYFETTLSLPLRGEYKLDVIAENNESKRQIELGRLELYRILKERFQVHGHIQVTAGNKTHLFVDVYSDGYHYFYGQYQINEDFKSKLEAESIFVEVYLDNELVDDFDLLNENESRNNQVHYPEGFLSMNKNLEIEGAESGKLHAIVKITDGLGEVYEFPIQ